MNNSKRKYGFNVSNQQPENSFKYASDFDLKHIEINLSKDICSLEKFDEKRIEQLNELSKIHNLELSFHVPYHISISEILVPIRNSNIRYLLKCIDIGSKLEATHLTLHLGNFYWFPVEKWTRMKGLTRFVRSLYKILPACEEKKIILAIENVVPIPSGSEHYQLGDNTSDFQYVFSELDSPNLKFCLDTGHANMGEGVLEYVRHFPDKLCCIHYHDNNGNNDEHLPIGDGVVPWNELAEELDRISFDGPIISECRNIKAHQSAQLFENYFQAV